MQQSFIDKEMLSDFSTIQALPFNLLKPESCLMLVDDILFRGNERILFVVDRIELLHFYGKIFSNICDSVGVVYGLQQTYHKKITILSSGSFQTRSQRLGDYDAIIFETFSKVMTNELIMERYRGTPIIGLTDSCIGIIGRVNSTKTDKQELENNMKLLERINRIFKRTTLKDIFEAFDISFIKKELLWFKGSNSLSIRINKDERFVFFEELQFKANKLVNVDSTLVRIFGTTALSYEVIEDIKTRSAAYEYILKEAKGSSSVEEVFALRSTILNPTAYLKASKHQLDKISYLMQQLGKDYSKIDIPEIEITSQVAQVLIAGLEEKRFRTTAIFARLKKEFINPVKIKLELQEHLDEEAISKPNLNSKENKVISEHVTLEDLKSSSKEKLRHKLLELTIELVQEEDTDSKKLTLELLKYLKTK